MFAKNETLTTTFQEAARLNTYGVHYLRCNNREMAHRNFAQAFRMLTQLLVSIDSTEDEPMSMSDQDGTCLPPLPIRTVAYDAEVDRRHECFYLFTQALIFQPAAKGTRPSKHHMTLSVMITLFNTALIYHLQGGTYCLTKASTLYQHILLIVQESSNDFACNGSEEDQERNWFYTLAVLAINNGMHISVLSKNIPQAYTELEDLDAYMNHTGADGSSTSSSPSLAAALGDHVAEELNMNLLVPGISIAAEAA